MKNYMLIKSDFFEFVDKRSEAMESYNVDATYDLAVDDNYGRDADGNRGTKIVSLDDFSFLIYNEKGEDITDEIQEDDNDLYKLIETEVESKGQNMDDVE